MCEVSIGEGVHLNAARRAHPPSPRRIFDFFLARLASSAKELLICISWNMGGGKDYKRRTSKIKVSIKYFFLYKDKKN